MQRVQRERKRPKKLESPGLDTEEMDEDEAAVQEEAQEAEQEEAPPAKKVCVLHGRRGGVCGLESLLLCLQVARKNTGLCRGVMLYLGVTCVVAVLCLWRCAVRARWLQWSQQSAAQKARKVQF